MPILNYHRLAQLLAAAGLVATPLTFVGTAPPAGAAANVQALLAKAEQDTNTVRTLVHHDQSTITTPKLSVKMTASGAEDEVHNRERDYESVSVKGHATNGTVKTLHYTVDIIFMNGLTYYRTTLAGNKWKSQKGMTFTDPYTGGWKRGRTTISFPKNFTFQLVGVSGGTTQVRSNFTQSKTAGTVDLWISGGSKPYVAREVQDYHAINGASGKAHIDISFGPFNTPLVIQAPSTQGST